jgi:hypothetical protein
MDWLRSEDLKEEKVVATSLALYHARRWCAAPNEMDLSPVRTRDIIKNCE